MHIPKLILDELNIVIPIYDSIGHSKENAIRIRCDDTHIITLIQNEIIDAILQEEPWRKTEQSLILDNDRKYEMITVIELLEDGSTKKHEFWFDITQCF